MTYEPVPTQELFSRARDSMVVAKAQDSEVAMLAGVLWSVGAAICERLDRLITIAEQVDRRGMRDRGAQ